MHAWKRRSPADERLWKLQSQPEQMARHRRLPCQQVRTCAGDGIDGIITLDVSLVSTQEANP